jgi:hypothetical protein
MAAHLRHSQSPSSSSSRPVSSIFSLKSSVRSSASLKRVREVFQSPVPNAPLCNSCRDINFWSSSRSASEDILTVFDYHEYQSHVPRCPLCTLILYRIPSFRTLGSGTNEPIPIRLKILQGQIAHVWVGGQNTGRIREVCTSFSLDPASTNCLSSTFIRLSIMTTTIIILTPSTLTALNPG